MKNNLEWYRQLYFGEKAGKHPNKILKKAEEDKIHKNLYFLLLPIDGKNVLELIPQPVLRQSYYQKQKRMVVGIACGKTEAQELAGKILTECYRLTGNFSLSGFLGDDYCEEAGEVLKASGYRNWEDQNVQK